MDILIFIAIFYALPQIFKKINENNKTKSGFNFEDIDTIKRELAKLKTSAEAKIKDTKPKSSNIKIEKAEVVQNETINSEETIPKKISEFHKKEAAAYNLDEKHMENSNKNKVKVKEKINLELNDKKELRRAIVMSEVLGKPRALKKFL